MKIPHVEALDPAMLDQLASAMGCDNVFLIHELLEIATEMEVNSTNKDVQQLRAKVAKQYVVQHNVLVLRLVWRGRSMTTSSWDRASPPSIQHMHVGSDEGEESRIMPAWICLTLFSEACEEGRKDQDDVVSMSYLDKQLGNPVMCCACENGKALIEVEDRVRKLWNEKVEFCLEGDTLIGKELRSHASEYEIQRVLVERGGAVLLSSRKDAQKWQSSIVMVGSRMEEEIQRGFDFGKVQAEAGMHSI
jgi:hypothetical protein